MSLEKKFVISYNQQKAWIKSSPKEGICAIDSHVIGSYFATFLYMVSCPHNDVKVQGSLRCPKDGLGSEATRRRTLKFVSNYLSIVNENLKTKYISLGDAVKIFFSGLGKKGGESELCRFTANMFPRELKIDDICPEDKKEK